MEIPPRRVGSVSHFYFIPKYITHNQIGLFSVYNYLIYVVIVGLLPIAYYFNKVNKQYLIKYTFIVVKYITTTFYY